MRVGWLAGALTCVLAASVANAALIGWECADDGDGAVTMGQMGWSYSSVSGDYSLTIPEVMNWSPAHLEGSFTSDTPTDPNVWVIKEVTNNMTGAWTGYKFNVYMMQPFSIPAATAPVGWNLTITPAAGPGSYFDSHGNSWSYMGAVDYVSTGPAYDIAVGSSGDFGAKLSFLGSVNFEIEQIAIVPEPASLALLALGGLFLRRARKA